MIHVHNVEKPRLQWRKLSILAVDTAVAGWVIFVVYQIFS